MNHQTIKQQIQLNLQSIRKQKPLVHNITNLVIMQFTANVLLAIGASPLYAHSCEELSEITAIANALVLNIGTPDAHWIKCMFKGLETAKNIPIVLDPVGAGASQLRTQTALDMLATKKITVLRGNAAEILALDAKQIASKGVDSEYQSQEAIESAKNLNAKYNCHVVISGATDQIINADEHVSVSHGVELLTRVVGTGCATTTLIAACCAIDSNPLTAAISAMTYMGIAAENAYIKSQLPGTFAQLLLDELYNLKLEHAKLNITQQATASAL